MTEDELAEALLAAWKAGTLRGVFQEQFPQLRSGQADGVDQHPDGEARRAREAAAEEYRRQSYNNSPTTIRPGLCETMREQHPEWSETRSSLKWLSSRLTSRT